jgi:hypothetical protein
MSRKNKLEAKKISYDEALLRALACLQSQLERELQRNPAERDVLGVSKWEPITKRIEDTAGLLLDGFAEERVFIEPLLILSHALVKAINVIVQELGPEGLGKVRTDYILKVFNLVSTECNLIIERLKSEVALN